MEKARCDGEQRTGIASRPRASLVLSQNFFLTSCNIENDLTLKGMLHKSSAEHESGAHFADDKGRVRRSQLGSHHIASHRVE